MVPPLNRFMALEQFLCARDVTYQTQHEKPVVFLNDRIAVGYDNLIPSVDRCDDDAQRKIQILEGLERTDRVNYMLAILYSRRGDDRSAVECYIRSCAQNRNFVHRGNLDPEISVLIRRYNLHAKQEEI